MSYVQPGSPTLLLDTRCPSTRSTSTLLSKLLALPNVKLYNATAAEDLIVKTDASGVQRVVGIVSNWTQVTLAHGLQSCMDPQTISAPVVCSFCGHDGPFGAFGVKRLASAGLLRLGEMAPLDMNKSENEIVNRTGEIFPGFICGGMELSEAQSVPVSIGCGVPSDVSCCRGSQRRVVVGVTD